MCDFPSWLFTKDGRVLFLKDKDAESLIENGTIKSWEDAVGHSAAEKVFGEGHEHREKINVPREVQNAIFNGEMNRLAKAAGYDVVQIGGTTDVNGKKSFFIDCVVSVIGGTVFCSGSKVDARDGSKVVAWAGSNVDAMEGSKVDAMEGSKVVARAGSRVDARAGSKVDALAGSNVDARAGSRVDARDGSKVVAWAGSNVDAMEGSKVVAMDGSNVVAWAGSKVVRK
jgi:hypothetical protein